MTLGKELIKSLKDPYGDITSQWMMHYLAEQIYSAEHSSGPLKDVAQKRAFETIMAVWRNRAYMPDNVRLFSDLEAVIRTLERLNPDRDTTFYPGAFRDLSDAPKEARSGAVGEMLQTALTIDQSARMLISTAIDAAAAYAVDEETRAWFKKDETNDLLNNPQLLKIIVHLYGSEGPLNNLKDEKIERLEQKLKMLKSFEEAVSNLQFVLMAELDEARSPGASRDRSRKNRQK